MMLGMASEGTSSNDGRNRVPVTLASHTHAASDPQSTTSDGSGDAEARARFANQWPIIDHRRSVTTLGGHGPSRRSAAGEDHYRQHTTDVDDHGNGIRRLGVRIPSGARLVETARPKNPLVTAGFLLGGVRSVSILADHFQDHPHGDPTPYDASSPVRSQHSGAMP
jgi:hypothetical protein